MKSKLWLNLGLLALIGALALLAVFEPGKEKEEVIPLARFDAPAAQKIELSGKETLSLEKLVGTASFHGEAAREGERQDAANEKKNGHWFITAPFQTPANEHRVELLLKIPAATSAARYPAVAGDLARYGLAPPNAVLRLGDMTLEFGDSDPIQQRRYVKVGDTLHLAEDNFHHYLSAPATDYVEKKLLAENPDIVKIEIPGLVLTREEGGKWRSEPAQPSPNPLYEMVDAWKYASAYDVKRHENKDALPAETIRITLAQGEAVEFGIVRREPELILLRAGWGLEFHLTEETSRSLLTLKTPEPAAQPPEAAPAAESSSH
jgi:hypothetical protein